MSVLNFVELPLDGGLSLLADMYGYLSVTGFEISIGPFHGIISYAMIMIGLICMDIGIDLIHHIWDW